MTYTDRTGVIDRFTYDELDRQTFAGYRASGTTYQSTVTSTYDRGDRLTNVVDSSGGTITRAFDPLDRLTSQVTAQGTIAYAYDKANRRTSSTVTGQPSVTYTYDNADDLTALAQGTASVGLTYDAAGRRTKLTLPNGVSQAYVYDAASQLTSIAYAKGTSALGNLTYTYETPAAARLSGAATRAAGFRPRSPRLRITQRTRPRRLRARR